MVSIIIPTYNHERWIIQSVESALNQTYKNIEVIVVNNSSTDKTLEKLTSLKDPRLKIITQENSGPSGALNKGIEVATGQWIALSSGDDVNFLDRIEIQLKFIKKAQADCLFADAALIDENGNCLEKSDWPIFIDMIFDSAEDLLFKLLSRGNFLCGPTSLHKTEVLRAAGPFSLSLLQLQDFEIWLKLCTMAKICYSQYESIHYRVSGNNLSSPVNDARRRLESVEVYKKFFDTVQFDVMKKCFPYDFSQSKSSWDKEEKIKLSFLMIKHHNPVIKMYGAFYISNLINDNEASHNLFETYGYDHWTHFEITRWISSKLLSIQKNDTFLKNKRVLSFFYIKKILFKIKQLAKNSYKENIALLASNSLVFSDYYVNQVGIPLTKEECVRHYLEEGHLIGYDLNPFFSSKFYKETNTDVNQSKIPAFVHYLKYGWSENRSIHPLIDIQLYKNNVSWQVEDGNPIQHYLKIGSKINITILRYFDIPSYLKKFNRQTLNLLKLDPVTHFLSIGYKTVPFSDKFNVSDKAIGLVNPKMFFHLSKYLFFNYHNPELSSIEQYIIDSEVLPIKNLAQKLALYQGQEEVVKIRQPVVVSEKSFNLTSTEVTLSSPYITKHEDIVILGGSRLLIDPNTCQVYHDEISSIKSNEFDSKIQQQFPFHPPNLKLKLKKNKDYPQQDGILLSCEHNNNYFHWLIEILPKVLLLQKIEIPEHVPFVVEKGLHQTLIDALNLMNTSNRPILYLKRGDCYKFKTLYYPSDLSLFYDRYYGKLNIKDCIISRNWLQDVSAKLKSNLSIQKKKSNRKIYIKRGKSFYRNLVNEEEVIAYLKTQNFEIISLDKASLKEQIELFSEAQLVVTPTGAACTNILFMNPNTHFVILIFYHPNSNVYVFDQLADQMNVNLKFISGKGIGKLKDKYSVHDDFTIPIEYLKNHLTS